MDQFAGEIRQLGARLQIEYHENSSGTGAFTLRKESGRVWEFHFYDGILKIKNVSEDVLSLIVCHELGHHLAGYPFKDESNWSAAEGQADYFSTHACAPRIWRDADGLNASFSTKISAALKGKCDDAYSSQQRRDLCYRTVFAVDTMRYYEGRNLKVVPSLDKPDPAMVSRTFTAHPAAQCRIDTQLAGAFCAREFDFSRVPGHLGVGLNTLAAERDAAPSHCDDSSLPFLMHRPRCWFASLESIHL
ncbi:hypothetical protein EBR21_10375 [bacterium]|nr:hypothetical protein [bacterium]